MGAGLGSERPTAVAKRPLDGMEIGFPRGLVGCPEWKRFVFRDVPEQSPIDGLECLDDPAVSLFVVDPRLVHSDYVVDMPELERQLVGLEDADDAVVLAILVIRHNPLIVTANLVGPLVINSRTRLGCQLVLEDVEYSVRHLVYSEDPGEGGKEDAA